MKKFLIKISVFFLLCAIVPIAFCITIDPYNVFHPYSIRSNHVEPNKNYIKMKYVLENPEKFDSYIFGSSRVGNLHTEANWSEVCYNMTYSEGLPKEALDNIRTMIRQNLIPDKIYLGVDSLSYTLDPKDHLTKGINAPYEYSVTNPIDFWSLYLDPAVVWEAAMTIMSNEESDDMYPSEVFYNYGWNIDYGAETTYDFEHAQPSLGDVYRMEETLDEIRQIVELCDANGIQLIVFTNPMHYVTYEASLDVSYLDFLYELAQITPYYNFSGYNNLTIDSSNYTDTSHYKPEIGDLMREVLCYEAYLYPYHDQGFGVYVTKENVKDWIDVLHQFREHFKEGMQ